MNHRLSAYCICLAGFFACIALSSTVEAQNLPIPTTLQDWAQPGTQPGVLVDPIIAGSACNLCHSAFSNSPVDSWKTSIMAQAGRDPIFHACLAIANQDAAESGVSDRRGSVSCRAKTDRALVRSFACFIRGSA